MPTHAHRLLLKITFRGHNSKLVFSMANFEPSTFPKNKGL